MLASQRGLDLTGELAGVTQPAIAGHGHYDRARPPEQGRALASSLPDAEFRLMETGHSPVYEAPAAVAAAVRDCPSANPLNGADDPGQGRGILQGGRNWMHWDMADPPVTSWA